MISDVDKTCKVQDDQDGNGEVEILVVNAGSNVANQFSCLVTSDEHGTWC